MKKHLICAAILLPTIAMATEELSLNGIVEMNMPNPSVIKTYPFGNRLRCEEVALTDIGTPEQYKFFYKDNGNALLLSLQKTVSGTWAVVRCNLNDIKALNEEQKDSLSLTLKAELGNPAIQELPQHLRKLLWERTPT